jgi:multidrug efflux pump
MDQAKLAAYQITALDVRSALNAENLELPAGRIEGNDVELSVRTLSRLQTTEEFNNLIIREQDGQIIRLRDIGYAELGSENERTVSKGLRGPRVAIAVVPQPGSNHIAIADEFIAASRTKKKLPEDELNTAFDTARYIRASIEEVKETIITAFSLVVLIIFLFLRDWRTTLIPVFAIPISLVGTFFIMYWLISPSTCLHFWGLLAKWEVDDAIVVLENIFAKIEDGMDPISRFRVRRSFLCSDFTIASLLSSCRFFLRFTGRCFRNSVSSSAFGCNFCIRSTYTYADVALID